MNKEINLAESIMIHAKALRRRLGARAPDYARQRAYELRKGGDLAGEEVWITLTHVTEHMSAAECSLPTLGR